MPSQANSDDASRILTVLNQLNRDLMANEIPEAGLTKILATAAVLLPVSAVLLWHCDDGRPLDMLRLQEARGASGDRSFPRTFPLEGSMSLRALERRRWQATPELLASDVREAAFARPRGLAALLCVPVFVAAVSPAGLLHCYADTPHRFSSLEVQTAEALTLLIGSTWQRAGLRGEVQSLKGELTTRKRVDRAKEILMDRREMSAEDAYRWIQKRSMDSRRSMREVAETIIQSDLAGHYSSIPHALDFKAKPSHR